jgi:hypothetical protein
MRATFSKRLRYISPLIMETQSLLRSCSTKEFLQRSKIDGIAQPWILQFTQIIKRWLPFSSQGDASQAQMVPLNAGRGDLKRSKKCYIVKELKGRDGSPKGHSKQCE